MGEHAWWALSNPIWSSSCGHKSLVDLKYAQENFVPLVINLPKAFAYRISSHSAWLKASLVREHFTLNWTPGWVKMNEEFVEGKYNSWLYFTPHYKAKRTLCWQVWKILIQGWEGMPPSYFPVTRNISPILVWTDVNHLLSGITQSGLSQRGTLVGCWTLHHCNPKFCCYLIIWYFRFYLWLILCNIILHILKWFQTVM